MATPGYDWRTMPFTDAQRQFLVNHPFLASLAPGTGEYARFLQNHPSIASAWNSLRSAPAPAPAPAAAAPAPATAQAAAAPAVDPFSPAERDAYSRVSSLFNTYGLGSLAPLVLQYAQEGYSDDTIQLML